MNNYVEAVNAKKKRLNYLHDGKAMSWGEIVKLPEYSCISKATAWRIAKTDYMPTGRTRRLLNLPPSRVRISADVEEWERQALNKLAAARGLTWSQYCKQLAAEQLSMKEK